MFCFCSASTYLLYSDQRTLTKIWLDSYLPFADLEFVDGVLSASRFPDVRFFNRVLREGTARPRRFCSVALMQRGALAANLLSSMNQSHAVSSRVVF